MALFKTKSDRAKPRTPIHIRYTGRAALISLIIALAALLLANIQSPGMVTAALKMVFLAASSVSVFALLFWVVFSGLHIAFSRQKEHTIESSGDLW